MILEKCGLARAAVVVGAQQPTVAVAHPLPDELGGALRGVEVARLAQHRSGVGQRRDHQRVPGAQTLVIKRRAGPPGARGQQPGPDLFAFRRLLAVRLDPLAPSKLPSALAPKYAIAAGANSPSSASSSSSVHT